ncbi:MAG: hypothetical protein AAGC72_03740 [Planctomycetota bacterium]
MKLLWTLFPVLALVVAMAGTWLGDHAAGTKQAARPALYQAGVPNQVQPNQRNHNAAAQAQPGRRLSVPSGEAGAPADVGVTFVNVQVLIDPRGKPLAAYQVELDAGGADFRVVGIEPAQQAAFTREPYYDRDANTRKTDRLILANYSVANADNLPKQQLRVATLHLALVGNYATDNLPPVALSLTAYGPDGKPIDAEASYEMSLTE